VSVVDGDWECVTDTPMGSMRSTFTVRSDGGTFTGVNAGDLGSLDVIDGRVDGNRLMWTMKLTKPMAIDLHASATIEGDTLKGDVKLGGFGSAPMRGTRVG